MEEYMHQLERDYINSPDKIVGLSGMMYEMSDLSASLCQQIIFG